MRVFSHLCAPCVSPCTCVRMPAHRLGAHPGLSEQRECTRTRSQQQHTRTSCDGTHLAPACTHPFMSVHPSVPHLTPVRTHPGTQSCTHTLNLPPPALPGAHKDTHALRCAHSCTFTHRGCSRAPHSRCPCVPAALNSHAVPQHHSVWHPHGSLAGTHQTPPWRWQTSGAAPLVPAALPPQRCHCERQRL